MLICALCVVPVFYAPYANKQYVGGGGGSSAWRWRRTRDGRANLFTTTSDMFPRVAVGSVVGIGAAAGALGNALMLKLAGLVVQLDGQLFHSVHDFRFGVPGGAGGHPPALAAARTGEAGLTRVTPRWRTAGALLCCFC